MRHSETCGCPVCQGVELRGGDKLPEVLIYGQRVEPDRRPGSGPIVVKKGESVLDAIERHNREIAPKRLLIVYSSIAFRREDIATMCEWMLHRGFNMWALKTYDDMADDIRVFDLDGAPAPDTGLIRQLIAGIAAKDGKVWTPGGEFIPVEQACDECEGAGQVTTDRATCLTCGGSGRKKQVATP